MNEIEEVVEKNLLNDTFVGKRTNKRIQCWYRYQ